MVAATACTIRPAAFPLFFSSNYYYVLINAGSYPEMTMDPAHTRSTHTKIIFLLRHAVAVVKKRLFHQKIDG